MSVTKMQLSHDNATIKNLQESKRINILAVSYDLLFTNFFDDPGTYFHEIFSSISTIKIFYLLRIDVINTVCS